MLTAADLTQAGIGFADIVLTECYRSAVPVEYVCVLLVKETGGGANVYGHDQDACMSVPGQGVEVTEANYAEYLECVAAGGKRNGVGPLQLTHVSLQRRADELGGCWRPEASIRAGVEHFALLLLAGPDARTAFRRYNGTGPRAEAYADDAMTLLPTWQQTIQEAAMPVLVVQMGHVGRPPRPGSVGTAGEQAFARRAADACFQLLHNQGGWRVTVIDADPNYETHRTLGGDPNAYRGDAFVAIHCDGSTNPLRDGASFGYRTDQGDAFAQAIKAAYLRRTGRPASWLEADNYTANLSSYYGTGLAGSVGNRRAVIFEAGFLTNTTDRAMLTGPDGPALVALAIGDVLGITQEDDMTPYEHDVLERISNRLDAFLQLRPSVTAGTIRNEPLPASTALTALRTQVDALTDDETKILAAVRAMPTGGQVDTQALAVALAPVLAPLISTGATPEQVQDAVRMVFADAGSEA